MDTHRCLSCNKAITWNFALCQSCERIYGNKAREWPRWLNFLWNDTQQQRRAQKRIVTTEVSMEQSHMDELVYTQETGGRKLTANDRIE